MRAVEAAPLRSRFSKRGVWHSISPHPNRTHYIHTGIERKQNKM
jgi:hypothetical protein